MVAGRNPVLQGAGPPLGVFQSSSEVDAKEVEAKQVKDERGGGWSRRNSTSAARSGWLAFTAKRQWRAFVPGLCAVIQTYSSMHHAQLPRSSAPSLVSSANISNCAPSPPCH